jgi:oxygen-dependent protoporphyrinogen oxidase
MMRVEQGQEKRTKDEWQAIALDSLQRHLRLPPAKTAALGAPARVNVSVDVNAIPQYAVGHSALVGHVRDVLQRDFPSLHLVGNSWGGVGVNDCVENAWKTVQRIPL